MILRLQSFFAGLLAVLTAALLALGAAQAKPASGGYQLFEPVALEHQHAIQLASLENFDYHAKVASECCNAPNRIGQFTKTYQDGTFSVSDWKGYPNGVPRPPEGTTYRLLTRTEYNDARKLANNTNRKLRKEWNVSADHQIHEIVPVKYGGSPTDPANKIVIPKSLHEKQVTPWWNKLQRDLGG
ncbi:putative filamentous hemagglutinin [Rhodobacteraceae bacterium KLH11]|nr:putative filamentous hemagglutinin [Rhodobacteraceae bacterium KLH11]